MGALLEDVAGTIHAHPTMTEMTHEGVLATLGHAGEVVKQPCDFRALFVVAIVHFDHDIAVDPRDLGCINAQRNLWRTSVDDVGLEKGTAAKSNKKDRHKERNEDPWPKRSARHHNPRNDPEFMKRCSNVVTIIMAMARRCDRCSTPIAGSSCHRCGSRQRSTTCSVCGRRVGGDAIREGRRSVRCRRCR